MSGATTASHPPPPSSLDGLPKQFVTAMRTLFDIMDDKRTGLVSLGDIEARWQDDGSKGLPQGVLESLRKVTPPSGALSFERFCAGLKICLLRREQRRPPSAPLLDPKAQVWTRPAPMTAQQRALSMPQLAPELYEPKAANATKAAVKPALYGPPKPPRSAPQLVSAGIDRAEIRNALQNWQMGLLAHQQEKAHQVVRTTSGRSLGDGKAAVVGDAAQAGGLFQKKGNVRRREPRRHTLQNGIDYNMLKRMKQIEQEKDVLMQGLGAVEKAREWYLQQVAVVQEKMKYLGRMGHVEPWSESQQERLELQRARVFEVNRHLAALTDSWERGGFPLHMNLAVHHYPQPMHDLSDRLKQQNRLLTEEVGKKSERISALEREKASLIQVLQMRSASTRNSGQEEAVF